MFSIFILVAASCALVRFALLQWRAIWISASGQPLSDSLHAATGIDPRSVGSGDFAALVEHCQRLYPKQTGRSGWLREVTGYYRLLKAADRLFRKALPQASQWSRKEMERCSRYVAVILDHQLVLEFDHQAFANRA